MKKWFLFLLTIVFLLSSCAVQAPLSQETGSSVTTRDETGTTPPETGTPGGETTPPETIDTVTLFQDKKSEYTIVYDGADSDAKAFSQDLVSALSTKYGVTVVSRPLSQVTVPFTHEILIGKARQSAKEVSEQMKNLYDFAVCVKENTLILCGQNEISYRYLLEYLMGEVFSKSHEGNLTLTEEENLVYSKSEFYGKNFVEYWREKNGAPTKAFMMEISESYIFTGSNGLKMPYRICIPFDYDPNKEYPVLLFLHGAGHRGSENEKPIRDGMVSALFTHESVPMQDTILIVPQCPSGLQWVDTPWAKGNYNINTVKESKAMKCVVELLQSVLDQYSTDRDRVYVLGLSMGGFGTWDIASRYTSLFAAAVPICGGGSVLAADALKELPIWTTHGNKDTSVPVQGTRDMYQAVLSAGSTKIHYTEFDGMGHSIGSHTARQKEIMEWLFDQKKAP